MELKEQIEKERVKLRADKNMVVGERNKAQMELEKKEGELSKAQLVQWDTYTHTLTVCDCVCVELNRQS